MMVELPSHTGEDAGSGVDLMSLEQTDMQQNPRDFPTLHQN